MVGVDDGPSTKPPTRIPEGNFLYWLVVAGACIVFGFLGILSIGFPFLVVGLAMTVLSPLRGRPTIWWPVTAGIVSFFAAHVLLSPYTCSVGGDVSQTIVSEPTFSPVSCTRLLLPDYVGTTEPDRGPPLIAAAAFGVVGVVIARYLARKRVPRSADGGS